MEKKNNNMLWKKMAITFSGIWILQWLIAAYTLDLRFLYGGAVTLLAIAVIAAALDVMKDPKD